MNVSGDPPAEGPALNPRKARIYKAAMELFSERGDPQANVSELAAIAGVSRSTIYNNIGELETLFSAVSSHVTTEMSERLSQAVRKAPEPEERLALSIRMYIRRSHEEPHWGRFMMRYALSTSSFEALLIGLPLNDVVLGMERGRYSFQPEQLPAVLAMVGGTVLTSMRMVQEGYRTWREAGSDAAELVLRSLGIPGPVAQSISVMDLPALPGLGDE
ncbi:MAG TPA: TetR/AcrR family transcriptional regulator [Burkholderiaceae bacterium]